MPSRILYLLGIHLCCLLSAHTAQAEWFCTEGASERRGNYILACGIAADSDEDRARKEALHNAFEELDLVCGRSADCRDFELNIEPKRNDCARSNEVYKCYRAVMATITDERRREEFREGESLQTQMQAIQQALAETLELALSSKPPHPAPAKTPTTIPDFIGCDADTGRLSVALADLSTPAKVDEMVTEAVEIPAPACWPVHEMVLRALERYRLGNDRYDDFLLETLADWQAPGHAGHGRRTGAIIDYFHAMGTLGGYWPAVQEALKHSSLVTDSLVPRALGMNKPQASREEQQWRLMQLLQAARAGEIGRPVPWHFDTAFVRIVGELKREPSLALYAAENAFEHLTAEADFVALHKKLFDAYQRAESEDVRGGLVKYLAASVERGPVTVEMGAEVESLFEWYERELRKLDDEEDDDLAVIQGYQRDREEYKRLAAGNLEASLGLVKHRGRLQNRIRLCARNGIACKGIMPSLEALRSDLASSKERTRKDTLALLAMMPGTAKQLEEDVVKNLRTSEFDRRSGTSSLATAAAEVLMAVPDASTGALEVIVEQIGRQRLNRYKTVEKMGARLVRPSMAVLENKNYDDTVRYYAAMLLAMQGPAAREAKPLLEKELKGRNSVRLDDMIRSALKSIE